MSRLLVGGVGAVAVAIVVGGGLCLGYVRHEIMQASAAGQSLTAAEDRVYLLTQQLQAASTERDSLAARVQASDGEIARRDMSIAALCAGAQEASCTIDMLRTQLADARTALAIPTMLRSTYDSDITAITSERDHWVSNALLLYDALLVTRDRLADATDALNARKQAPIQTAGAAPRRSFLDDGNEVADQLRDRIYQQEQLDALDRIADQLRDLNR